VPLSPRCTTLAYATALQLKFINFPLVYTPFWCASQRGVAQNSWKRDDISNKACAIYWHCFRWNSSVAHWAIWWGRCTARDFVNLMFLKPLSPHSAGLAYATTSHLNSSLFSSTHRLFIMHHNVQSLKTHEEWEMYQTGYALYTETNCMMMHALCIKLGMYAWFLTLMFYATQNNGFEMRFGLVSGCIVWLYDSIQRVPNSENEWEMAPTLDPWLEYKC